MSAELFEKAEAVLKAIESSQPSDKESLEKFRIEFLGSKGEIKSLSANFRNVENTQKKAYGQLLNKIKDAAQNKHKVVQEQLEAAADSIVDVPDLSAPPEPLGMGSRHPISVLTNEIVRIFQGIGFTVIDGPEIEDDWHNFTALNTPEDHPARDMQDTFYLLKDISHVLRTQTSSSQVHVMENTKPPIRIISPGRVYRNETVSARSHCQFHQVEGLYIDKNVSFADLKQTLLYFAREMYGPNTKIRLRPSFFPFTEPSAELDVSCFICDAKGCNICKYTGWVEILGCGMVDPAVLENCGIDPDIYTGFAFGMGIERPAMLKYKVNDIRLFFENDVRFLNQFQSLL